ncbi:hypothetical protein CSA80_00610 [Candidatus Saccharibacteria bacterium]|nr:MAG: hypothetical protein CSA80_00610 [Candidatus Saccharibacteria bacterium]
MGLLDNVFRSLDDTLKAIENGAIEEKLDKAGQAIERFAENGPKTLEKAAEAPSKAVQVVETKAKALKQTSQTLKTEAAKTIDIVQRPE